ncbi:3-keto-disaccharide hydrolase [Membranihabitans marinus]|uniref:3-keto-disaccharide hydrolase n=1 Tax=Membranihabitans marinus TaxID=1227546 RepID=UPI001F1D1B55|nr:DUF1080 domain-containing protein [Membranihabitans marinus]
MKISMTSIKYWSTLCLLLPILLASCGSSTSSTTETAEEDSETIKLFNGENLDGWYTFLKDRGRDNDPKSVFTVEDGIIKITGEEWGCITTDEEYENYHLTTEFKWGGPAHAPREDKARDCGILVHSIGEDGAYNGTWMLSIEVQIIEGGTGDFIVVGDKTDKFSVTSPSADELQGTSFVFQEGGEMKTRNSGRVNWWGRSPEWKDTIDFRGPDDVEKPVGEWNTLEVIAEGDTIVVILNGVVVNKAFNVSPSKGRIQIQSEAAEIHFRKIDLKPL